MRIVLVLLCLEIFAFGALNPKSCYTVQVVSAVDNIRNYEKLLSNSYDRSCKVMKIGSMLTVRCGCFDEYKQVKKHLKKMKKSYKRATIVTTYKSRFATKNKLKAQSDKREFVSIPVESSVVNANVTVPAVVSSGVVATTPVKSREVVDMQDLDTAVISNDEEGTYTKSIAHTKKKKKHKKKKHKKVKKSTKVKYVKKREKKFFYDRYIALLKHEDYGIGKYDYRYAFGGQISYDFAYIDEANGNYKDKGLRRFRLWHDGSFFHKKLFYEFEYSFIGDNNYKDVYVGYKNKVKKDGLSYRVKAGNLKVPFSLERYTSSKYNTFMERALTDAFSISRKLGAEILLGKTFNQMRWNLFGSYFSNSIDERQDNEVNKPGFSTRITVANKFAKREIVHFGIGLRTQDYKGEEIKIKQGAESDWVHEKYVSTKIKDVDSVLTTNIEAMFLYNKYYLQGEYVTQKVSAVKGDYNFYGYYLQGSYFLVGRGKRFKVSTSTMSKVKPTIDGAVELAARYAYINLNDKDEHGGQQQDLTLGVNWYIDDKLRLTANYILANPKETDDYDGIFQIWQARALFFF